MAEVAARGGKVLGVFYTGAYLDGGRCVEHCGELLSRSAFERVGGSSMAKWYRSIKVRTKEWRDRKCKKEREGVSDCSILVLK